MSDAIDVVASGHTHQAYNCEIDGKLVTSGSSFGRLVTDIDLSIDRRTGDVLTASAENVVVTRDVPPFATVYGNPARVRGANTVAMRRRDVVDDEIRALDAVYRRSDPDPAPFTDPGLAAAWRWWVERGGCTRPAR